MPNYNPKIAIIGCGNIANEHANVLKAVGFDVTCCTSSPGSKNAFSFAKIQKISRVFFDYKELLHNENYYDCILIACSTDVTFEILTEAMKLGKPILVEKPITKVVKNFDDIDLNNNLVRVGYNRRFYSTVQFAKKFIKQNSPFLITLELPDYLNFDLSEKDQDFESLKDNSIHALDIIYYLNPNFKILQVLHYEQPNSAFGKVVILKDSNDNTCIIKLNWNTPSNFNLSIEALPYRLELLPFEKYKLYKGISILEPNNVSPVRRYLPKVVEVSDVFVERKKFKPGFLAQSKEFFDIVNGKSPIHSASLKDAQKASFLAYQIINFNN